MIMLKLKYEGRDGDSEYGDMVSAVCVEVSFKEAGAEEFRDAFRSFLVAIGYSPEAIAEILVKPADE